MRKNTLLFAAERAGGNVEAIQQAPGADSFRFTSLKKGENDYALELQAASIGSRIPDAALAFPDLAVLRRDVPITDLNQQLLPVFVVMLRDGRAWMAKFALAAGADFQKQTDKMLDNPDWNQLRRRDADLGAKYRSALAKQGIVLRPLGAPAPATQPAR